MFHNSTQKNHWTFTSEEELKSLRRNANINYRKEFCDKSQNKKPSLTDDEFFVTPEEHEFLVRFYEQRMREFCWGFTPPMPLSAVGTACQYMKRLYLRKSVMEYHPSIMCLVCVWLACKTEEFNISMDQFQQSVLRAGLSRNPGIGDAILALELALIQELNFHLVIHSPFRPLEGFLIDLKTRFPSAASPEQMRKHAKDFLVQSLNTDVGLLFCPSQIALSALLSAASKRSIIIDRYVTDVLLQGQPGSLLKETIQRVKKIRLMVKANERLEGGRERAKELESKLDRCRNKDKDPTSAEFERIQRRREMERDERQVKKRRIEQERQKGIEIDLLGF